MIHYLYKITSSSGLFYVGRHSTKNMHDGYLGSGVWPKSIKTKERLRKEIIKTFDNEVDLKIAEACLLAEVINHPKNMNYSNSSSGFSSGERNPANTAKERERRSKHSWTKTEAGRKYLSEHSEQFKTEEFRTAQRQRAYDQLNTGKHNFQKPESITKKIETSTIRLLTDNPMHQVKNRAAASQRAKTDLNNGKHNFLREDVREKNKVIVREIMINNNPMKRPEIAAKFAGPKPQVTCPHCQKIGAGPSMYRFHFDKCKSINATEADGKIHCFAD